MQSSVTNSAYVSFDGNGRPGAVTFCPFFSLAAQERLSSSRKASGSTSTGML
jgi:hypothetical protein